MAMIEGAVDTSTARDVGIAWAAGLFDGEGCSSLDRAPSKAAGGGPEQIRARMSMTMQDEEPMRRFQAVVGGKLYGPYKQNPDWLRPGNADRWQWVITKRSEVNRVLRLLAPHLSSPKLVQALNTDAASNGEKAFA